MISLVTSLRMQNVMSNFKIMDTERVISIKGKVHNYYAVVQTLRKNFDRLVLDGFSISNVR